MKYFAHVLKIVFTVSLLLMLFSITSCKSANSRNFNDATSNVTSFATEVTVKSYTTGQQVKLTKDAAEFVSIIGYIQTATVNRNQPRYNEINGKNEEVKIPYVLTYNLAFKISDGSRIIFDFGADQIWYTTKDTLSASYTDTALAGVLDGLMNK